MTFPPSNDKHSFVQGQSIHKPTPGRSDVAVVAGALDYKSPGCGVESGLSLYLWDLFLWAVVSQLNVPGVTSAETK